jgi:site-specific DNA recombinase
MPLAVCYTRFSPRPNAAECTSNRKQFSRIRSYCDSHDYPIVAVRWDRGISGKRADNRPGLERALRDACKHKAVRVVYALDRLARSPKDALAIAERLNAAGADLAAIRATIDTRSPTGRFVFTLFAALAQLEREQIAERTSDAMRFHQANGRRMTRADLCPSGWRVDPAAPDRLAEDAEEQAILARIRAYRQCGMGARPIARALDAAVILCHGHRWHESMVRSILKRVD